MDFSLFIFGCVCLQYYYMYILYLVRLMDDTFFIHFIYTFVVQLIKINSNVARGLFKQKYSVWVLLNFFLKNIHFY